MSRHSSISSALTRLSHSSPNASNPLSTAPRPTDSVTRPPDSRSTVATWLASSAGRRRDGGVSNVPSRMRDVRTAATASEIHASTPHTGSQTKIAVPPRLLRGGGQVADLVGVRPRDHEPEPHRQNPRRGRSCRPYGRGITSGPWTSSSRRTTTSAASRCGRGSASIRRRRAASSPRPGYVVPHWPRPWGLDADPIHQLLIDDELARAAVRRPVNPIGIGWAGPTILYAGTKEQKDRYLWPMISGEEFWCQLFSEPGSGSDLASLGTRAVRDGDEFVVNGQKIWTSGAQYAKFGILIARTDPDLPKHKGVSYFICPMDAPGDRDPPDHRDDRRTHVQRGVLHRRANARGEPRRRAQRRLATRQGDARQRAHLAVERRRALGQRPDRTRPRSTRRRPPGRRPTRRCASGWPGCTSNTPCWS